MVMPFLFGFRSRRRACVAQPARRPSFAPRLEVLEDRSCPSGGTLDPGFDGDGVRTLPSSDHGYMATAVQGDGKVLVVGTARVNGFAVISVTRLNRNGSLDATFNGTGSVNLK